MVLERRAAMRQISLFEYEAESTAYDRININELPEAELVRMIGCAVGMNFTYRSERQEWTAKTKHMNMHVHYSHYTCRDREGQKFISVGYDYRKDGHVGGSGSPCDTIEEAIRALKTGIERWA